MGLDGRGCVAVLLMGCPSPAEDAADPTALPARAAAAGSESPSHETAYRIERTSGEGDWTRIESGDVRLFGGPGLVVRRTEEEPETCWMTEPGDVEGWEEILAAGPGLWEKAATRVDRPSAARPVADVAESGLPLSSVLDPGLFGAVPEVLAPDDDPDDGVVIRLTLRASEGSASARLLLAEDGVSVCEIRLQGPDDRREVIRFGEWR